MCKLSLDHCDAELDERDNQLFMQYSVDMVYASYAAAQNRLKQYSQLLHILQRDVEE